MTYRYSRKSCWILLFISLAVFGWYLTIIDAQREELVISVTVKQLDTQDFAGTKFFELKRGHFVAIISADPMNPIADYLTRHKEERVILTLGGVEAAK